MDTDDPTELLIARWEDIGITEDDDAEPEDANVAHEHAPEDD